MMPVINVMIVDDSAVVRQVISGVLSQDHSIHILAAVADPIFAMQRMRMKWPDVIVLDVEMPRMDGVTFLKKIMAERPTPGGDLLYPHHPWRRNHHAGAGRRCLCHC